MGRWCGRKAVKGGILKMLVFKEWRINKYKEGHIQTSRGWYHGNLRRKIQGKGVSDATENDFFVVVASLLLRPGNQR